MKQLNEMLDVDDLTTPSTMERLDYMAELGVNDERIIGRLDFVFPCTVHVNRDRRWFLTETSATFYEIDPMSLKKVTTTINIIAYKHFNPREYLIRTDDGRLFQGKNEVLQHELDSLTLKEKVDKFFHPSILVGFRDRRLSRGGYGRKFFVNNQILLRSIDDVYAAMIDIADGNANVRDYSATNGTRRLMDRLRYVQQVREVYGKDYALERAMDYIISDMNVPTSSFNGNGKKGVPFHHKDLMLKGSITQERISPDKVGHPQYGGERFLVVDSFIGRLLVSTSMLGAISVFSNRGNRYYI